MSPYQLIGVLLAVDGILLGLVFGLEKPRRWINKYMIAFIGICIAMMGFQIFLFGKCVESDREPTEKVIRDEEPLKKTIDKNQGPKRIIYEFEEDVQGWGEHPEGAVHVSGQGVEVYCDNLSPISRTGNSSLQFNPTKIVKNNAYVTVLENARGSMIEAHIFVPSGADISTAQDNSTAKIIVWDNNWTAHESDFIELNPGVWQPISWDLHERDWPGPWREFGVHFYFVTDYKGPIYIDTVTVE